VVLTVLTCVAWHSKQRVLILNGLRSTLIHETISSTTAVYISIKVSTINDHILKTIFANATPVINSIFFTNLATIQSQEYKLKM
jgi:hypothetical protein